MDNERPESLFEQKKQAFMRGYKTELITKFWRKAKLAKLTYTDTETKWRKNSKWVMQKMHRWVWIQWWVGKIRDRQSTLFCKWSEQVLCQFWRNWLQQRMWQCLSLTGPKSDVCGMGRCDFMFFSRFNPSKADDVWMTLRVEYLRYVHCSCDQCLPICFSCSWIACLFHAPGRAHSTSSKETQCKTDLWWFQAYGFDIYSGKVYGQDSV